MITRCSWAGLHPLYISYHDKEWGVPLHDDKRLFEFLVLDGAQAGLSWLTILKKRNNYRHLFDGFDPEKVAAYDDKKIEILLHDPGIVRNRLKILGAIENAKAFLDIKSQFGSFDSYIWRFVNEKPLINEWKTIKEIPPKSDISVAMSKDLIKKGFKFTGPVICYSFMQAAGMVNDHITECFRYTQINAGKY